METIIENIKSILNNMHITVTNIYNTTVLPVVSYQVKELNIWSKLIKVNQYANKEFN